MDPAPIGTVTQVKFEVMVRRLFDYMNEGWWTFNPMAAAVRIAHVLCVLDSQPELLTGRRLTHNLGEVKMAWLTKLYDDYRSDRRNYEETVRRAGT